MLPQFSNSKALNSSANYARQLAKLSLGLLLFVCFLAPAIKIDAKTNGALAESLIVDTRILNVRAEPEGKKIGRVHRGQQFLLLKRKGEWGQVQFTHAAAGWIHLGYVKGNGYKINQGTLLSKNEANARDNAMKAHKTIPAFCHQLNADFDRQGWKDIRCDSNDWRAEMRTVRGNPLIYSLMGEEKPISTLLLCGVHSDEHTAYQCFKLMAMLKSSPELLTQRLVVVPIVNPDGFLRKVKTRTNHAGVDLNRNLPTTDWARVARRAWKSRFKSDPRRNPGKSANSELENQFIVDLVNRYSPDKVISIHAPLNFLDLDFQELHKKKGNMVHVYRNAKVLANEFSKSSNFRFHDYNTFPGSLGRYGNEWMIPIYTLELPTSDPSKSRVNFKRFRDSMVHAFNVILDERKIALTQDPSQSRLN